MRDWDDYEHYRRRKKTKRKKEVAKADKKKLVLLSLVFLKSCCYKIHFLQGWDTVQAFASSISGSLATAAVLEVCSSSQ
jgi:hypothetical protein